MCKSSARGLPWRLPHNLDRQIEPGLHETCTLGSLWVWADMTNGAGTSRVEYGTCSQKRNTVVGWLLFWLETRETGRIEDAPGLVNTADAPHCICFPGCRSLFMRNGVIEMGACLGPPVTPLRFCPRFMVLWVTATSEACDTNKVTSLAQWHS